MEDPILSEFETNDKDSFIRPTLSERVKSVVIDSVVVILLFFAANKIVELTNIESTNLKIILLVLIILYEPFLTSTDQTIGQKIIGIKVINKSHYFETNKEKGINILQSLIRYLFKIFLGWVSLITINFDKTRKSNS